MPIGLGYVAGTLARAGHAPLLVNFTGLSRERVRRLLAREKPAMIGLTLYTFNRHETLALAAQGKEACPRAAVVVGGPHATHCAESVLAHYPQVDFVVRGEGEETAVDLARALERRRDPSAVPGLALRGPGGSVVTTPARPPLADLDALPFPHRYYESVGVDTRGQFSYLVTSRGCLARCNFCGTPEFWGQQIRYRSPANVLAELRELRERFGLIWFSLRDDTFTVDKQRVLAFCKALVDSRLGILWDCQSRVNAVDLERLQWMRRAGCEQVQYGVEHAAAPMLRLLCKGTTAEQVRRAAAATRRAGLLLSMYLITGIPGETRAHFDELLALLAETRPHDVLPARLGLLPGTELFRRAVREHGWDESFWRRHPGAGVFPREDAEALGFHRHLARLARTLARRNRYTRSDFEAQRREMGDHFARDLAAAAAFEAERKPAAAEAELRALLSREPGSVWGHVRLADFLMRHGREREALTHLDASLTQVPQMAPGHAMRGQALLGLGDRAGARRALRDALKLDPFEPTALELSG